MSVEFFFHKILPSFLLIFFMGSDTNVVNLSKMICSFFICSRNNFWIIHLYQFCIWTICNFNFSANAFYNPSIFFIWIKSYSNNFLIITINQRPENSIYMLIINAKSKPNYNDCIRLFPLFISIYILTRFFVSLLS